MWILSKENDPATSMALLPGMNYSIGRYKTDILIEDDISVSREHAHIVVYSLNNKNTQGVFPPVPDIDIKDLNSKFGTFVGDESIEKGDKIKSNTVLGNGMRIRVGLFNTIFRLSWTPLVVSTSFLTNSVQKEKLDEALTNLKGAKLQSQWTDEVTHLVMTEVFLTIKVLNSLSKCVPIVLPEFLRDFAECAKTKQLLPRPEKYVPPLGEPTLNKSEISCAINPERKSLFAGKTFIFPLMDQMRKYFEAIHYAGGKAMLFKNVRNPSEILNRASSFIVIHAKTTDDQFNAFIQKWRNLGLIPVPETDIGIALVKCSCESNCNPRKKANLFQKPRTPPPSGKSFVRQSNVLPLSQSTPPSMEMSMGNGPFTSTQRSQELQNVAPLLDLNISAIYQPHLRPGFNRTLQMTNMRQQFVSTQNPYPSTSQGHRVPFQTSFNHGYGSSQPFPNLNSTRKRVRSNSGGPYHDVPLPKICSTFSPQSVIEKELPKPFIYHPCFQKGTKNQNKNSKKTSPNTQVKKKPNEKDCKIQKNMTMEAQKKAIPETQSQSQERKSVPETQTQDQDKTVIAENETHDQTTPLSLRKKRQRVGDNGEAAAKKQRVSNDETCLSKPVEDSSFDLFSPIKSPSPSNETRTNMRESMPNVINNSVESCERNKENIQQHPTMNNSFISKLSIKERQPDNQAEGTTIEELSRSYCKLQVVNLFRPELRTPSILNKSIPSSNLPNVKRFKKQQIPSISMDSRVCN